MSAKMFFSCCLLPPNSISNFLQSSQNFFERRAVELVIAAIDVPHYAAPIDYQSGRVRDVERVGGECVTETVGFGHGPILIEPKDAGDGMVLPEFSRFPHRIPLYGGIVGVDERAGLRGHAGKGASVS